MTTHTQTIHITHGMSSAATILGWMVAAVAVITLPLWIGPAIVWLICTGRSLKSCGHEANAMSEGRDGSPQPSALQEVSPC